MVSPWGDSFPGKGQVQPAVSSDTQAVGDTAGEVAVEDTTTSFLHSSEPTCLDNNDERLEATSLAM